MRQNTLIQRVVDIQPEGFPFISVYLNTETNENGKFNYDVSLKNYIREHADVFADDSADKESFTKDVGLISDYLENVDPTTKGLALFACSGSDVFEAIQFQVPFEEDTFSVLEKPKFTR